MGCTKTTKFDANASHSVSSHGNSGFYVLYYFTALQILTERMRSRTTTCVTHGLQKMAAFALDDVPISMKDKVVRSQYNRVKLSHYPCLSCRRIPGKSCPSHQELGCSFSLSNTQHRKTGVASLIY